MKPLEQKRVFLVGGPGGVGKTTLAAALGVQLAAEGYKTVVLTVDPAKRLAQALGFENFKTDLQEVKLPPGAKGTLVASMLDTQRYFDRIIERFATSEKQRDRILQNPIYRAMVDSLGGTHEYAAMERLLEFASDPTYEKVIVDTPPSQNAVDLLTAPQRLADFMDNSVLRWFQGSAPVYLSLFKTGTRLAMKLIRRLFGAEFLDSFAKFMDDVEGMQAGFRQRNLRVLELLQSDETAFFLVTYPSEARYLESVEFLKTLEQNRIRLSAVVLNRVEPECPSGDGAGDLLAQLPPDQRNGMEQFLKYANGLWQQQRHWIERFRAAVSGVPTFLIEKRGRAPQDVETLAGLGNFLQSMGAQSAQTSSGVPASPSGPSEQSR